MRVNLLLVATATLICTSGAVTATPSSSKTEHLATHESVKKELYDYGMRRFLRVPETAKEINAEERVYVSPNAMSTSKAANMARAKSLGTSTSTAELAAKLARMKLEADRAQAARQALIDRVTGLLKDRQTPTKFFKDFKLGTLPRSDIKWREYDLLKVVYKHYNAKKYDPGLLVKILSKHAPPKPKPRLKTKSQTRPRTQPKVTTS